jgi:predicted Zn-dependent protease
MTSIFRAFRLLPLFGALALGGCATNPVTGGHDVVTISEAQEIELGQKMHPQILQQYGRYDDEALQSYVNDLGQRIAARSHRPNLKYTFTVLDSDEVNAFALPGGYVYITRGIIAYLNNEAELVGVMGHEVGHVTARHAVRQQTGATAAGIGALLVGVLTGSGDLANAAGMAGSALISGYGRDMELEADGLGAEYLNRLGYDPKAMIDVVSLLKNQEMLEVQMAREEGRQPHIYHGVFASHPDNDTRLQEVVAKVARVETGQARPDNREAYLQHLNGLPVGPSRAQGIVRGSRFYHADLGITMAFPAGWTVDNLQDRVMAYTPQKDAVMIVTTDVIPNGASPQQSLARMLNGVAASGQEPLTVNGLPGYTAIVSSAKLPWGNQGPMRVAVVYFNNLAYVFRGATRTGSALSASDPVFLSSIKTFRRMKESEFALAEPNRIRIVQAAADTRIENLAKSSPIKKFPVERLRLLNDLYPDKEPIAGQQLKIVE